MQTPKNYQWPADKLTTAEMEILCRIREATGIPINQLLRDAVMKLNETAAGSTRQPEATEGQNSGGSDPKQPR